MAEAEKVKIGLYWGATCGGCDVAILDIDHRILEVAQIADIVFWPVATDFKYKDLESYPDGSITLTFYNGAIRNSENEHIAKLLRKKSLILVAFGSCACFGGIPGLANVSSKDEIFKIVYSETPSTVNPEFVTPQTKVEVPEGILTLPEFYDNVVTLDEIVDVDYYMPGCPPSVKLINTFLDAIIAHLSKGIPLPPRGAIIASEKTLCDECKREKKDKKLARIYRVHEIKPDPEECLLDQGIICLGPATRGGCEAKCINANMPCRGCMGPTAAALDQGGSMLSALSSILNITDKESQMTEEDILALMKQVRDPLGTFYRFSMPKSLFKRAVREVGE